jgi:hypothetical protein
MMELYLHSFVRLLGAMLHQLSTGTILLNSMQCFIYLSAELNGQWPIMESAWIQTATAMRQHRRDRTNRKQRKIDQLRLFILKFEFLKVFIHLQTAFAAET